MQADTLQKLWEREIDRITPEGDPLNLMGLLQLLMERIRHFLDRILPEQSPVRMPDVAPRTLLITIAVMVFCALLALFIRQYGSRIRETVSSLIPRDEFSRIWSEFNSLIAAGSHAKALRFFVRSISSIQKLGHYTFSEMFPSIGEGPAAPVSDTYGRVIHKNGNANRDEVEKFAAHAASEYPGIARTRTTINPGGEENR